MKDKTLLFKFNNSAGDEKKITGKISFDIDKNAIKAIDEKTLMFARPLTLMDGTELWSGAKYDMATLDISEYKGKITADHIDKLQNILGKVIGLQKIGNKKVTIDGIELAVKENPLADFVKRMILAGYITDFSIETLGPWPGDDGVFRNSKMIGLSIVVTGNNKQAHINALAKETIESAEHNGLDTASFKEALKLPLDKDVSVSDNILDMFKTIKNTQSFPVTLKYKNAAGEDAEITLQANQTLDVTEAQEAALNKIIAEAKAPEKKEAVKTEPAKNDAPKAMTADEIAAIVKNAVDPLTTKIAELEQKKFDNAVEEPQFTKANIAVITNKIGNMDYHVRHGQQVLAAWNYLRAGNTDALRTLNEINKYNFEELQKANKVPKINPVTMNAITIADMGNYVLSRELLTEIEGMRSNFTGLLSRISFKDTLSTEMAWLTRSGDIDMEEVEFCDDDADGNLKPVKEYGAEISTSRLNEIAAVTPVCNAATRFLAADLLGDVAEGYRTDWDRKKAQLFIARLQQAVNETGLEQTYNTASSGGADVNALKSIFAVGALMQEDVMNGVFILSHASLWELRSRQAGAGINTDAGFNIFTSAPDATPLMFGAPYIVVPNELLPKLGSAQTRSFVVGGVTVTITSAIFYVDLTTFTGRTSGGLQYDLSTEASYEVGGEVRSAYQRNELVLRGSGFRGGAVKDPNKVVGLRAVNVS